MKDQFESYFKTLEDEITGIIEMVEGKTKFTAHSYSSDPTENGVLKIIKNGQVLQKGAVHRYTLQTDSKDKKQYKTGLHITFHPKNPNAPTLQTHYEYHQTTDSAEKVIEEGVAGEMNLIPNYLIAEDASYFHRVCREICSQYNPYWYPTFKEECDQYFWNPLRRETLGIGGIYFENITPNGSIKINDLLSFIKALGAAFIPSYMPILEKRKDAPTVENHRNWQAFRWSRFIEFDFLFNPHFSDSLKASSHPDALLAQLPPKSEFKYAFEPQKGSRESRLVNTLKNPREWV